MTRDQHKKQILRDLATILNKDQDLMPNEIDPDGPDGLRWQAANEELIEEFERRSK